MIAAVETNTALVGPLCGWWRTITKPGAQEAPVWAAMGCLYGACLGASDDAADELRFLWTLTVIRRALS